MPDARCVKLAAAAAYVGIPVREFQRQRIGEVSFGTHVRYDLRAIDAHLDRLHALGAQSPASSTDEAEAAFARSAPDLEDASRRP